MLDSEILGRVDHTLLKMTASWAEIKTLCDEAVRYKTASVCIPPSYVKPVFNEYGKERKKKYEPAALSPRRAPTA